MASQQHLQMLDDGESISSTSGDDDDDTSLEDKAGGGLDDSDDSDDSSDDSDDDDNDNDDDNDEDNDNDKDDDNDDQEGDETPLGPSNTLKKRIKLSLDLTIPEKVLSVNKDKDDDGQDDDDDATMEEAYPKKTSIALPKPRPAPTLSTGENNGSLPPKKKFRSKVTLPLNKLKRVSTGGTATTDEGEVKAMIVDSDEAGEDDAVAKVVDEATAAAAKKNQKDSSNPKEAKRKTAATAVRPIRLPSMSSPGLLIPPSNGVYRGSADANGFTTPQSVFEHTMSLAGYSTEGRTKRPHRGSSVQRTVGDMFDSNVKFSLHFPKLVPSKFLRSEDGEENANESDSLPQMLLRALSKTSTRATPPQTNGEDKPKTNGTSSSRKKRKLVQFSDMAPLSLTIPYPEQYIQKRLEYVKKVHTREKAIVAYQEEQETLEIEAERKDGSGAKTENGTPKLPTVVVPPIPEPPSPPRLQDLEEINPDKYDDQHPYYLPKGKEQFVAHLDKTCFHIVDGRYFGLLSNAVADPHFVGPNAPGISGLNLSGGTGLATAHSGGPGASAGLTILEKPAHATIAASTSAPNKGSGNSGKTSKKTAGSSSNKVGSDGGDSPVVTTKKKSNGPVPTASSSELRRIIEDGGDEAEKMKTCIIRAAVHASRASKHGQSFKAPNGQTYPDVSKAFAAHAGLKPCMRCKNNKQGAYHCRLRRKHKDLDYDGSNSPAVLAPLFYVPMPDLLWKL